MVRKLKKKDTQLKAALVKMKDNDYIINFDNYTGQIMERYYKALDLLEQDNFKEAALIFRNLINNVQGHFDSIVALIGIYNNQKDLPNISKTFNKGVKDMKFIFSILPEDGKLPWAYSSNKGFLRFIYNLGIKYIDQNKLIDARDLFIKLLELDNEDSLNATEILCEIYIKLNSYEDILDITEDFSEKAKSTSTYNRLLALLALDKKDEAKELIKSFSDNDLKIYSYLEETTKELRPVERYISYDLSRDKNKTYWKVFISYWHKISGALDFLKENIIEKPEIIEEEKEPEIFSAFEQSMKNENLKSITINNHLNNIDLFRKELPNVDAVIEKIKSEFESFNKTLFTKTITSLNKFFTYIIEDKEELKNTKLKLKRLKDKYLDKF